MGEGVALWPVFPSHGTSDRSMFFSWFEMFFSEIFWDEPFLAVNLLKYSKYLFFFAVDFSFHGSSQLFGI